MNRNWNLFLVIWLIVVSVGPITLLINFPLESLFVKQALTINFFQRLIGLILFSLIFTQVVLGSQLSSWIEKLTGKIFRFHIVEGVVSYILMIAHPILGSLNGVSLIPIFTRNELLYNLGRFGFMLFTIGVFAGLYRSQPFIIRHWKKFHMLNYVAFFLIAVHSYYVGSDTQSFPFIVLWWIATITVSIIVILKLKNLLLKPSSLHNQQILEKR